MALIMLAATALVCIVLERFARLRFRTSRLFRDYLTTDIVYLASGITVGIVLTSIYKVPTTQWIDSHISIPRVTSIELPFWISVIFVAALIDFANFLAHYLMHRFDVLWEFHKVHHSALIVDWLVTYRSHIAENVFRNVFGPIFVILIGFPLDAAALGTGFYIAFAVFNHSNTKLNLRFFEPIFITPRIHRMHHNPDEISRKNLGTIFTFWDRLFGSLELGEVDCSVSGVPGEVHTYPQSWLPQFFEPFLRILKSISKNEVASNER